MAIVLDHTIVPAHDNEDGCQCLLARRPCECAGFRLG